MNFLTVDLILTAVDLLLMLYAWDEMPNSTKFFGFIFSIIPGFNLVLLSLIIFFHVEKSPPSNRS